MKNAQRGVSLAIFLVVFAVVMVAFLAVYALSRLTGARDQRDATRVRLDAAVAALEQFVATAERLPCPANPTLSSLDETGEEARNADLKRCTFNEGTVPWKTIGLRRDDAYDGWGRRISYRVFTGNPGTGRNSLAQAYGASMVQCDTVEPGTGATNSDGICIQNTDPLLRSTKDTTFLAGKGLTLADMGTNHTDVAFVLVSHGSSGRGAYTASGARIEMPTGTELANTRAAGPFTIMAFSDAETSPKAGTFFDDLLAYRRLPDLLARTRLVARNWPDLSVSALTFDQATVGAAAGNPSLGSGGVGASTLDFGSASVAGVTGGTASQLSFDTVGGVGGIGVIGTGTSTRITFFEGESLTLTFDDYAEQLGITLLDFGIYNFFFGTTMTEHVTLSFYNGATQVGSTITKAGCAADGGLASFQVNVGAPFNRVTIAPGPATGLFLGTPFTWDTQFLLSAVRACTGQANCRTDLWTATTACP